MKAGAEETGAIKKVPVLMDTETFSTLHFCTLFKITFLLCSPLAFMQDLWFKASFPEYSLPVVTFYPQVMELLFTKPGCVALEEDAEEDGDAACEGHCQAPKAINTDG